MLFRRNVRVKYRPDDTVGNDSTILEPDHSTPHRNQMLRSRLNQVSVAAVMPQADVGAAGQKLFHKRKICLQI